MPRESYREGKRVAKRALLNLSHWPPEHVEGLRGVLKGGVAIPAGQEALEGGTLYLHDVSSSYVEAAAARSPNAATTGTARRARRGLCMACCARPTAARRRSRCLKAVRRSQGNFRSGRQAEEAVRSRPCRVGGRGLITQARIDDELRPAGLDWITTLRAPAPQGLVAGGHLQMSPFDDRDLAVVTSPEFPGERLIVCRNADLARERANKREDLLKATERDLAKIAAAVSLKTRPLRGAAEIDLAVGAVIDKHKMAKHIELTISDTYLIYRRKTNPVAVEAALDGLCGVRTSLPRASIDEHATVRAYKSSRRWSARFDASSRWTCMSARPIMGWKNASAPTCFSACSPTMSNGTCAPA